MALNSENVAAEYVMSDDEDALMRDVGGVNSANDNLRATYESIGELLLHRQDVQFLLNSAGERNPFYSPEFMEEAYVKGNPTGKFGAVLVRGSNKPDCDLIGMFPIEENKYLFLGPFCPLFGLQNINSASTAPLLREGYEAEAVTGFLSWLQKSEFRRGVTCVDELNLEGASWLNLKRGLDANGHANAIVVSYDRSAVDINSAANADEYELLMKSKTRQNLNRKYRKLEKLGEVKFTCHEIDERAAIIEEFSELEMRGWKGSAGTALASNKKSAEFAKNYLSKTSCPDIRLEALRLYGRPIAMTMHYVWGGRAFHFKPTYDEQYSQFSPGLLLHRWTMRQMYETKWAEFMDSAAVPESQLGSVWKDRVVIGRVMFANSAGNSPLLFKLSVGFDQNYRKLRPHLKKLLSVFKK